MRHALGIVALVALAAPAASLAEELFDQPASAEQLLQTILALPAAELSSAQVLRGRFIQRRNLSGLPRPLVSRGEFLLARDTGILWETREPFASEFVLTESGMILRDGDTQSRVTSTDQPALRAPLELFLAVFALDLARLEKSFELYGEGDGSYWRLDLRPRQARMAEVFTRAIVSGSRYVERIELEAPNGDRTEIELTAVAASSEPLDAHEGARFR